MKKKPRRSTNTRNPWKEFERSVSEFLQRLLGRDPNAIVRYDPPILDRDTKRKQQVDAWIDYKIGGHLPVKMLISCKNHGRKLDIGAIRTFIQERADSGASAGAIYSPNGFSKDAIAKANANGIGCFQLFRDRRADKPKIEVSRRYWCWDTIMLPTVRPGDAGLAARSWDELLDLRIAPNGVGQSVAEYVEEALRKEKDLASIRAKKAGLIFPMDFVCTVDLQDSATRGTTITIECRWKRYQGKLSAAILNGSFCVSTGEFVGTESFPSPVTFPPPENDWEEIAENPMQSTLAAAGVKTFLFTKNSAGLMMEVRNRLVGQLLRMD
jgi:hypothetical protein